MKFKVSDHIKLAFLLCLTIGLTPYFPVPHSYEKIKWFFQGGNGMQTLDYFDLIFHNIPWFYLIIASIFGLIKRRRDINAKTKFRYPDPKI
jgi:hypothetical protein